MLVGPETHHSPKPARLMLVGPETQPTCRRRVACSLSLCKQAAQVGQWPLVWRSTGVAFAQSQRPPRKLRAHHHVRFGIALRPWDPSAIEQSHAPAGPALRSSWS